ncbi:hypothetical protein ACRAWF_28630 [Streptomyces sp. L7]
MDATAEQLPFPDGAFDAAMTTFSVHRWSDPGAGIVDALGGTVAKAVGMTVHALSPSGSPAPVAGPSCLARLAVGLVQFRERRRSVVERQCLVLPEVRGLEGVRRRRGRSRVGTAGRPSGAENSEVSSMRGLPFVTGRQDLVCRDRALRSYSLLILAYGLRMRS